MEPETPTAPIQSASFSTVKDFEACPYRVYLAKVEQVPPPEIGDDPKHPLVRGDRVHKEAEAYIRGEGSLTKDLRKFSGRLEHLAERYAEGFVEVEEKWGFTTDWQPCDWKSAAIRMIADAVEHYDPETKALHVIDWKGLALDTPVPTPTGWTTMGELAVGDTLFDDQGAPCTVTAKSDVHHRRCFRVTFDDTSSVICDDVHKWVTNQGVIETADIYDRLSESRTPGFYVPLTAPLQTEASELPIEPYLLGVWLGDGKHTSGEICKPDPELWDELERLGHVFGEDYSRDAVGASTRARSSTIYGLRTQLRQNELLGNKRIPECYLRASYEQRLALVQGLMDTDGNVNTVRKQAVFTTTDKGLSDQMFELLVSLGQRPLQSATKQRGFGKTVTAYPISFRPVGGFQPFRLPRKRDRIDPNRSVHWRWTARRIQNVEEIDTVPTQCIQVDSPNHTFLCTQWMIPTHNTGKSFNKEVEHTQQRQLYAIGAFMRYPEIQFIESVHAYLDEGKEKTSQYTRANLPHLLPNWDRRLRNLLGAMTFPPKANRGNCRFCDFGLNVGTGACPYAVPYE